MEEHGEGQNAVQHGWKHRKMLLCFLLKVDAA